MNRSTSRARPGPVATALLALGLGACAPLQTHASVSTDALFMPGGQQLALICANQGRVARGGALVWNDGLVRTIRQAPYLVSCRDYTLRNDGAVVNVQDDTLAKALTRFEADAGFLTYAPGLSVRFPQPGLIDPGAPNLLSDGLPDTLRGVSVTVSQAGAADAELLRKGAVLYDPARPVTLRLKSPGPVAWPEVTIEANKGLITAPVYRR